MNMNFIFAIMVYFELGMTLNFMLLCVELIK